MIYTVLSLHIFFEKLLWIVFVSDYFATQILEPLESVPICSILGQCCFLWEGWGLLVSMEEWRRGQVDLRHGGREPTTTLQSYIACQYPFFSKHKTDNVLLISARVTCSTMLRVGPGLARSAN